MLTEFFLAAVKAQRDEGGRRILLGDNTSVGAVMLPPIRLNCVEFGFQLECLIYTYLFDHVCIRSPWYLALLCKVPRTTTT
jgi:hypothetical protein